MAEHKMSRHDAIKKVLDQLRGKLGTTEHPPGSNHNFITVWYNEHVAKIGDGPWCQMTDTWSVWSAGFKELLTGTAWTVQAALNAQRKLNGSSWHPGVKGMKKGDQVYYDWTGGKSISGIDHTGTVEKINGDGTFYVLEGNASDALRRVKRDKQYVVGYVRHDWNKVSVYHPKQKKQAQKKPTPPPANKPTQHPTHQPTHNNDPRPAQIIEKIQQLLGVHVDGIWGPKTDEAVLSFRRQHKK